MNESRVKEFNEELRARLEIYRDEHQLTNGELGRELGKDATAVSKYLNSKPEGNVEALESTAEDVLKNARRKKKMADTTTLVTDQVRRICGDMDIIRKTNDVGLIHGPAGVGKSIAWAHYLAQYTSVIGVTLSRGEGSSHAVERLVFSSIETARWKGDSPRIDFIRSKLTGSNRLLAIDNAHRLTASGIEWLFDLHDQTRLPVALLGNPELLDEIKKNDQHFSRIGLVDAISMKKGAVALAAHMVQKYCGAKTGVIDDLARRILKEQGHGRGLRKHLVLMDEFLSDAKGDHREALMMAHTKLVTNYRLT